MVKHGKLKSMFTLLAWRPGYDYVTGKSTIQGKKEV